MMRMGRILALLGHPTVVLLFLNPLATSAQKPYDDRLSAIACELRELRSVIRQGQILGPLVEANVRERLETQTRISALKGKRDGVNQLVQELSARQARNRRAQQAVSRLDRNNSSEKTIERRKHEIEGALEDATQKLNTQQSQLARLSTEISLDEGRLAQLMDEFAQIQRQMLEHASADKAVCDDVTAPSQ